MKDFLLALVLLQLSLVVGCSSDKDPAPADQLRKTKLKAMQSTEGEEAVEDEEAVEEVVVEENEEEAAVEGEEEVVEENEEEAAEGEEKAN